MTTSNTHPERAAWLKARGWTRISSRRAQSWRAPDGPASYSCTLAAAFITAQRQEQPMTTTERYRATRAANRHAAARARIAAGDYAGSGK